MPERNYYNYLKLIIKNPEIGSSAFLAGRLLVPRGILRLVQVKVFQSPFRLYCLLKL